MSNMSAVERLVGALVPLDSHGAYTQRFRVAREQAKKVLPSPSKDEENAVRDSFISIILDDSVEEKPEAEGGVVSSSPAKGQVIQSQASAQQAGGNAAVSAEGVASCEDPVKVREASVYCLVDFYGTLRNVDAIHTLLGDVHRFFMTIPKAKTAKIVRNFIDLIAHIPNALALQENFCLKTIQWCIEEKRTFLRHRVETRLALLYHQLNRYSSGMELVERLLQEVKRLDDKLLLVEIHYIESKLFFSVGNMAKAKAALTAARSNANAIHCPPLLQADIDIMAGAIHCEEGDPKTAFSYFFEAFEAFNVAHDPRALQALKYMMLSKLMCDRAQEVATMATQRNYVKYAGREVQAFQMIAKSHEQKDLKLFEKVLREYAAELSEDSVIGRHTQSLYQRLLEKNIMKVLRPFYRVEVEHVARLMDLPLAEIQAKLSEMILDKQLFATLDQGAEGAELAIAGILGTFTCLPSWRFFKQYANEVLTSVFHGTLKSKLMHAGFWRNAELPSAQRGLSGLPPLYRRFYEKLPNDSNRWAFFMVGWRLSNTVLDALLQPRHILSRLWLKAASSSRENRATLQLAGALRRATFLTDAELFGEKRTQTPVTGTGGPAPAYILSAEWDSPEPLLPPTAQDFCGSVPLSKQHGRKRRKKLPTTAQSELVNAKVSNFETGTLPVKTTYATAPLPQNLCAPRKPATFQVEYEDRHLAEAINVSGAAFEPQATSSSQQEFVPSRVKGNTEMIADAYAVNAESLSAALGLRPHNGSEDHAADDDNKSDHPSSEADHRVHLTPAQQFFLDHKETLIQRAQHYERLKQQHFENVQDEQGAEFDTFFRDPVLRPPKGHVWEYSPKENAPPRTEVELEQGRIPSMEQLLKILEQEHIADVKVIDLERCGRRDLGLFFILGTGQTGEHCARVGKLIAKLIRKLEIPYLSNVAYCWGASTDCWIVGHCGPLQLHLLTEPMRQKFQLERMLIAPHEHFLPELFPGYFDTFTSSPPPYILEYLSHAEDQETAIQNSINQTSDSTSALALLNLETFHS